MCHLSAAIAALQAYCTFMMALVIAAHNMIKKYEVINKSVVCYIYKSEFCRSICLLFFHIYF